MDGNARLKEPDKCHGGNRYTDGKRKHNENVRKSKLGTIYESPKLLDVPVGTAVFTEKKWSALKNTHINCLDYSKDMIAQAEQRLAGLAHIEFIQGDVGNLPMADESFDIVVSMNGFHAFPDKKMAFSETWRVLKNGEDFIGCFYIKGKSNRTDWLVRNILAKNG